MLVKNKDVYHLSIYSEVGFIMTWHYKRFQVFKFLKGLLIVKIGLYHEFFFYILMMRHDM